jgi:hypothetical protein
MFPLPKLDGVALYRLTIPLSWRRIRCPGLTGSLPALQGSRRYVRFQPLRARDAARSLEPARVAVTAGQGDLCEVWESGAVPHGEADQAARPRHGDAGVAAPHCPVPSAPQQGRSVHDHLHRPGRTVSRQQKGQVRSLSCAVGVWVT